MMNRHPAPDGAMLAKQAEALSEGCALPIPMLANVSALLRETLPEINWVGFYLSDGQGRLVLGQFQGRPACTVIPFGRGVCGTAAASGKPQLVPDVHLFPGHIACDAASASELVIPLIRDGSVLGVLDIDSPVTDRFSDDDLTQLKLLTDALTESILW